MRLNNKGFAVAGVLYSILVLFLIVIMLVLGILSSRKILMNNLKNKALEQVNNDTTLQDEQQSKVYGLRWTGGSNYKRLKDAAGMEANAGVGSITVKNDFDNAEIYKDIVDITVDGNEFVKIPKFYIKKVVNTTTNIWEWYISKEKADDKYYLPLCFYDHVNNKELDYVLIGKYHSSLNSTKLESKTGTTPIASITMNTARTYAVNNNTGGIIGYQLLDIHALDAIQVLFYVEFATLNSQSIMYGYAYDNSNPITNGTTSTISSSSGSTLSNSDGHSAMKYRGIENLWGNYYQFVDGLYLDNDTNKNNIFVNKNPDTYADYTSSDYYSIGYNRVISMSDCSNISKMNYDVNNPFIQFPSELNDSEMSQYNDKYCNNNNLTGKTIIRFGGISSSSFNTPGISLYVMNYNPDSGNDAASGARIMKKPI